MVEDKKFPKVGVGVIIQQDGQILLLKRKGSHGAGTWSLPGGHLEWNEELENCAKREVEEECGIKIFGAEFFAITNDRMNAEDRHYITIFMKAQGFSGEPKIMESEKCDCMDWFDFDDLPQPLFSPLDNLINGKLYPANLKLTE
jgi:8-oxo-dGTP diphosphatase